MTLLDQWNDVDGRIRGMAEFNGEYVFASMNGILRWDPVNETWLSPWTPSDGLPSESQEDIYSMKTIGNSLWLSSGSYGDGLVMVLYDGNWSTWEIDSGDIPDGYGADIVFCDDIVHVAIGFESNAWWRSGGGIARFDTADHDGDGITNEWISPITEDNSQISNRDPRAMACDNPNRMLYIGFDAESVGINRFSYNSNNFLSTLDDTNGVSEGNVFPGGMLYDNGILFVAHFGDNSGITRIMTSGNTASNGIVLDSGMDTCSIARAPSSGSRIYAIGRSGESTGINRVDRLDNTGLIQGGFDQLIGLPGGSVQEMISNSTHIWVTSSDYFDAYWGSTILQGELIENGSVNWQYGVRVFDDIINELRLDGEKVWISTVGGGLMYLNTTGKTLTQMPTGLHRNMDGLYLEDGML